MARWAGSVMPAVLLAGCIPQGVPPRMADASPPPPQASPVIPPRPAPTPRLAQRAEPRPSAMAQPVTVPVTPGSDVAALPAPRPAWEASPVTADAQLVAAQSYTIRSGDTLRRVAERTGAGVEAIAQANGLAPPYPVQVGQMLGIPGGRYHLVRRGETGIAIARAYGVEWSRIVAANALAEPYVLRAGQRVLVPEATTAGRNDVAERAAAFQLDIDDILTGGEPALATREAPAKAVADTRRVLPATKAVAEPRRLATGFGWPVEGRVVTRFGPGRSGERNDGIKIAVPVDTPVRAAADGVVAYAGDGIAALGGLVILKHGSGWTSVYGHASKLLVQRGQAVKRGQEIARSGDTGYADRPELHFELRKGRVPVDPVAQLPRL